MAKRSSVGRASLAKVSAADSPSSARAAAEQRQAMLASVLKPEARERRAQRPPPRSVASACPLQVAGSFTRPSRPAVARIALVKPEKARGVENMILSMAQRGQITEKARSLRNLEPPSPRQPRWLLSSARRGRPGPQVSDETLLSLLEKVNEQVAPKMTARARTLLPPRAPLLSGGGCSSACPGLRRKESGALPRPCALMPARPRATDHAGETNVRG